MQMFEQYRNLSLDNAWMIVNSETLNVAGSALSAIGNAVYRNNFDNLGKTLYNTKVNTEKLGYIAFASIKSIKQTTRTTIPVEPQEGGTLFAYNKVRQPIEVEMTLLFDSSMVSQMASLYALQKALDTTATFLIIARTDMFANMSVISFSYTRDNSHNTNMLEVVVQFRQTLKATTNSKVRLYPKNPTSAGKLYNGFVQGVEQTSDKVKKWADTFAKNWKLK